METMERKKPRPCRSFTPEFKAEIVELCRRGDRSIGQVARDFDLTETNVRTWVKQAEIDQGERPGLTTEERAELTKLRRENRSLREDVEILKRATAFFARGDPVKVDPFIEAEKVAGHNVAKACGLLEVSKSAYYERRNGVPSARTLSDADLSEKIKAIHAESKGTYGAPRIHKELLHRHVACGKRKVTRLMRQAGLEGRCKKRWRTTTVADPTPRRRAISFSATSGRARRSTGAMSATSPTSAPGRAGPTWPRSSTWPAAGSSAGPWPITCAPSWSKTPSPWRSNTGHPKRASFSIRTGAVNTRAGDFAELARANGVVLSVGRKGECWDNAVAESFFATIKRELIDTRAWPTRAGLRRAVFEYIEGWYNTRRLHSTLGYLSPAQYEAVHHNADRQAA